MHVTKLSFYPAVVAWGRDSGNDFDWFSVLVQMALNESRFLSYPTKTTQNEARLLSYPTKTTQNKACFLSFPTIPTRNDTRFLGNKPIFESFQRWWV